MDDTEPVPDERVKALLGRLPSKADRERLAKVRELSASGRPTRSGTS
jgi:hypothetical protein